ncbi:LuxR C-terminal-related transcriptional regulator [Streptomyces sp. NBC_00078]|uniref:helix-turn-helix transcriptional regulator n=1 Tax=unclassified Streptomyces TaxID=2593676 RepID=UPI00224D68CE|nr:LuxR C-terminal-related transcriptional regulator [Streptomyces sp. NBC_00078]MCX5421506.1 LuxR C-terminal-related transcriptional regulator [Streptomyces sp. NBC_00078]
MLTQLISANRKVVHDQNRLLEVLESTLADLVRPAGPQSDCAPLESECRVVNWAFGDGALAAATAEVLLCLDPTDLEENRFGDVLRYAREAFAQGVGIRCICAESMVNVPGGRAQVQDLQEAGVEIRVAALLPFRLLLVDRRISYVHVVDRGGDISQLEITDPGTCQFAHQVFDYCWLAKTSSRVVQEEEASSLEDFSERELIILRMLANGMKDEAMARALCVSTRTLRRVVTDIMGKLGVSSRFQMGARAAEYRLLWSSVSCE